MKQTRNLLMALLWADVLVALLIVGLFETGFLEQGLVATEQTLEFYLLMLMELATIGLIPLALRLFKFRRVHDELVTRQAQGLQKWGVARIQMLTVPMMVNAFLYELFFNTTFGYLAIILVICLPFVYPTMARCEDEVSGEK